MAERQVALVPTMVQLEKFESYAQAGEAKFPAYAKHMRALAATRMERFGQAREAGVPIYAGTRRRRLPAARPCRRRDRGAGPVQLPGVRRSARAPGGRAQWLGRPATLEEGAPADLVVFDDDPRADT